MTSRTYIVGGAYPVAFSDNGSSSYVAGDAYVAEKGGFTSFPRVNGWFRYLVLIGAFYAAAAAAGGAGDGGSNSYTIEWYAPTAPGGTITAFTVYYGKTSGALNLSTSADGSAADARNTLTLTGLTSGVWYFAVSAVVNGIASEPSPEETFTV